MTEGEPAPKPSTIFHLEMFGRDDFRPSAASSGFVVKAVSPPDPALNRSLYRAVGGDWEWTDKLGWTDAEWQGYTCREALTTYVGYLNGREAGYFELEMQAGGNVEIAYFGMLPEFIGKGLGGALLSSAVELAWESPDTRRVWVHTCTEDHENALANYLKRGFTVFKTEMQERC